MVRKFAVGALALVACSAFVSNSFAAPQDDLTAAAKKVADSGSYSWKTTIENAGGGGGGGGGGGRGGAGPSEGQIDKDGVMHISMTRGQNTMEGYVKGTKGALKTADGWKSFEEAMADDGSGQRNPNQMAARQMSTYKAPAAQAAEMAADVKDLKEADGAWGGTLSEDGAKKLLVMGGRPGGNAPDVSGAKGTVKFWIADGALTKMEYSVQGTVSFNGNDRQIDRKTTVEFKDVGSAKVEVPEEAMKKMS